MKVLMTGGTGFIGSRYIDRYSKHEYTVLVRDLNRAEKILPNNVKCIVSLEDLCDLDDFDAVINLAGEPIIDKRWSDSQKDIICQSRWRITEQLAELIEKSQSPPKVFISGSAIGVYGNRDDHLVDESALVHAEDFPSTVCVLWEGIAARVEKDVRVVNLRTGIVLAKEQGALAKMLLPFKLGLGGPIGSGQQYMSWIHIDDMTAGIEFLLNDDGVSGPVNLVSPNPVNNREFTKTLASQLKRIAVLKMPEFILNILLGESSTLLLDSQRIIPKRLMSRGFEFQYPNLDKAFADLLA